MRQELSYTTVGMVAAHNKYIWMAASQSISHLILTPSLVRLSQTFLLCYEEALTSIPLVLVLCLSTSILSSYLEERCLAIYAFRRANCTCFTSCNVTFLNTLLVQFIPNRNANHGITYTNCIALIFCGSKFLRIAVFWKFHWNNFANVLLNTPRPLL